jgi:excisionase family DNA binding protein
MAELEELVKPSELCKILKVSKMWPYRMAKKGVIPYHKMGDLVRFKRIDIEAYLQKTRKGGEHD